MNPPIFDGHNDTVLQFLEEQVNKEPPRSFFEKSEKGHIDLPRAQEGGLGGGFFAIFTPNDLKRKKKKKKQDDFPGEKDKDDSVPVTYETPLPPMVKRPFAQKTVMRMMSQLYQWEDQAEGKIRIVRTAEQLEHCLQNGIFAIIIHFEGAEAIDTDLNALHVFYEAGLRSIGPVWSRPTKFGNGVPFNFPATPDIGKGLTKAGKRLVKACNELGIMVDMSHLNEKGFWDIAKISTAPLVCTHSNAHACAPTPRNLLDAQLDAIKETGGVTGMNYHKGFLRADGRSNKETSLTEIVRHAAYIADRIGVDHVTLGSDFDGASMPEDLKDAAGLPKLLDAFRAHGFNEEDITKIAYGNWLRVLRQTWKG
ncbi:MAG: membrane dipeptidase [Ardenticatenaceae bacterium]|nr:membrane dipeptidase [Ardenticatenaceae bacterium]